MPQRIEITQKEKKITKNKGQISLFEIMDEK